MTTFIVSVREVHVQQVKIDAASEDEAKNKVADGEGEYLDDKLEYSHTLDKALWTVDQVKEGP
jgi:hypothetical protein